MDQRGRIGLTPQQHVELWDRWKAGESLSDIGRALGRVRSGIHKWLASRCGIAPPVRRRSARSLSIAEREAISRGLSNELSIRRIAADLGRAPSTISVKSRPTVALTHFWCRCFDFNQAAPLRRASRRSSLARPYI